MTSGQQRLSRKSSVRTHLLLAASIVVLLAFSQAEPAYSVTIIDFGVPQLTQPRNIVVDRVNSPNRVWFTTEGVDGVGAFDPSTGTFSLLQRAAPAFPEDITIDPDGNVWFSDSGTDTIVRVSGSTFIEYQLASGADPTGIASGRVGSNTRIYFTERGTTNDFIGEIDATAGTFREWALPSTADPQDIVFESSTRVWFTEAGASKIGLLNPTTGVITEFTIFAGTLNLFGITVDSSGNVWFTANPASDGRIGRLTFQGGLPNVQMFVVQLGSANLRAIAPDDNDNLWFAAEAPNRIGKFDRFSNYLTLFAPLPAASLPFGVAQGVNNEIWFTERAASANKIGRIIQGPPFRTTTLTSIPKATTTTTATPTSTVGTVTVSTATTSSATTVVLSTSTAATATSSTTQTETIPIIVTAISGTSTTIIATTTVSGTLSTTVTVSSVIIVGSTTTTSTTVVNTSTATQTVTSFSTVQTRTTKVGTIVVNPPISGFPAESILAGIVLGVVSLMLLRRGRSEKPK